MHADVVKTEWHGARQRLVARVTVTDNGAELTPMDQSSPWEEIVLRSFTTTGGREVTPAMGQEFVLSLHESLHGDYVYATEAHDETECPFREAPVVEFLDMQHRHVTA